MRTTPIRLALPAVAAVALGASTLGVVTSTEAHAGHGEFDRFALTDTMDNTTDETAKKARSVAKVKLEGDRLTVSIRGTGFTPNSPHAQHFHGSFDGDEKFTCPDSGADKDDDGQVNTEEGLPDYGDIVISLTTKGDTSAKSGLAVDRMPKADKNGELQYKRTIKLPDGAADKLQNLHIVQHGIDVNGNDKYDAKALGESTFAKSKGVKGVPEEATNPVTCGTVSGDAAEDDDSATASGGAGGAGGRVAPHGHH